MPALLPASHVHGHGGQSYGVPPEQLVAGFGALFEEFLLLADWQLERGGPAVEEEPEEWPDCWNPVVVGGATGQSPPDGQVELANVRVLYPRPDGDDWPRLVLFRGDGARLVASMTPFALAKQGPRRLGDTRAVLRALFTAIGSIAEGREVIVDDRGVVKVRRRIVERVVDPKAEVSAQTAAAYLARVEVGTNAWIPFHGGPLWWLRLFDWIARSGPMPDVR